MKKRLVCYCGGTLLLLFSFSSDLYAAPAVTIENLSDSPDPFSPDNAIDDTALISAEQEIKVIINVQTP